MCDDVCVQVVRRVRDQVDSGIDRCEQVGRVIKRLYSQHFQSSEQTRKTRNNCPTVPVAKMTIFLIFVKIRFFGSRWVRLS